MASDNHANYAKVGLTVALGVAAVVGTLVYFGGYGDRKGEFYAETYSNDPVSGLSVGSEVNFRGVKVGEVREISFIGAEYEDVADEDRQKIYIKMAMSSKLARLAPDEEPEVMLNDLVKRGLRATVTASGVTGLSKLELNLPKGAPYPASETSWTPEHVCIPPEPSILQSFSDSATQVMDKIKRMDFLSAWSNVTDVAASVARMSQDVCGLVETQRWRLDAAMGSLEDAARSLKELADEVRGNPSLLLRPRDPEPLPETSDNNRK